MRRTCPRIRRRRRSGGKGRGGQREGRSAVRSGRDGCDLQSVTGDERDRGDVHQPQKKISEMQENRTVSAGRSGKFPGRPGGCSFFADVIVWILHAQDRHLPKRRVEYHLVRLTQEMETGMKKSVLFFDIDGTPVKREDGEDPESAMQALHEAQRRGHMLFINTGGRSAACL